MKRTPKNTVTKISLCILAMVFAVGICIPNAALAEPETTTTQVDVIEPDTDVQVTVVTKTDKDDGAAVEESQENATESIIAASDLEQRGEEAARDVVVNEDLSDTLITGTPTVDADEIVSPDGTHVFGEDESGDCTVTLHYNEIVMYDSDGNPLENFGERSLGTYILTGIKEGTTINTWDLVASIPGHFFFDAWPAKLEVSADPQQNVINLFYGQLLDSEYTVNYYLMTGADLSSDTWSGALAADTVEFHKLKTETFDNQLLNKTVLGDAYAYQSKGMYVIDTYPSQITLGVNPDDNVINVLYVPANEVPPLYDDVPNVPDENIPGVGGPGVTLPDDEVIDYDDIAVTLPDDFLVEVVPDGSEDDAVEDGNPSEGDEDDANIGDAVDDDAASETPGASEGDVTVDMVTHPMDPSDANQMSAAYSSGVQNGSKLVKTGDTNSIDNAVFYICLAVIAVAAMITTAFISRRDKRADSRG